MLKFLTELPMENSFKIPNRISNASFFDIDGLGCRLDPPFRRVALSPITSESSILFLEVFIHHREWKCIPCFQKYPSQSLSKMRLSFRRPAPTHPWLRWPCPPKLPRLTVPEWPIGPRGTFSHPQNTCHLKYSPSNTFQIPPQPLNPQKLRFFLVSAESKIVNFHKYKVMNILWGSIFIGTFKIWSKVLQSSFMNSFCWTWAWCAGPRSGTRSAVPPLSRARAQVRPHSLEVLLALQCKCAASPPAPR